MKKRSDLELYGLYIKTKKDPKASVTQLCRELKMPRATFYTAIKRIQNGDAKKADAERKRLERMWERHYKPRFKALPRDRRPETVQALRIIIKEMVYDGFPPVIVAKFLGKDRTTIHHHLWAV